MAKVTNNYKHITRVAQKGSSRPVLSGLSFKDGRLAATDGHRMLIIQQDYPKDLDIVLDPKTLLPIEGNYPELDRHLEGKEQTGVLEYSSLITISEMLSGVKSSTLSMMSIDVGSNLKLQLKNGISLEVPFLDFEGEEFTLYCNYIYLKNAVEFILDQTPKNTSVYFRSPLRPFILYQEDKFDYLITPIIGGF